MRLFQFFPSCCQRSSAGAAAGAAGAFQFFPSCCSRATPAPSPRRSRAFNSFPVAVYNAVSGAFRALIEAILAFNSFPVAVRDTSPPVVAHPADSVGFQFFPSCCVHTPPAALRRRVDFQFFPSCCPGALSPESWAERGGFQFFPSCCMEGACVTGSKSAIPFQFFPSCCERLRGDLVGPLAVLSILSQLLLFNEKGRKRGLVPPPILSILLSILSQLLSRLCHAASL
jgi:hypothetical protein